MEGEVLAVPPPPLPRSPPAPLPYLPHLDGLRAAALTLVLAYHFKVPAAGGGYVGVDVFLVLSGFLMTRTIQGARTAGTFHLPTWYASRFWRLYPAALVTSTAAVAAAALLFPPALASRAGASAAAASGLVANLYFWSQEGYFDVASAAKPLLHMWSLSLEEQFYAIYPAALVLLGLPWRWRLPSDVSRGAKVEAGGGAAPAGDGDGGSSSAIGGTGAPLGAHSRTVAAVGMASAVSLAQAHLSALRPSRGIAGATAAFFLLSARMWEFGAGAGVALLSPSGLPPGRSSEAVAVAGAAAVLGAAACLRAGQYPVSAALPAVAGAAALIASPTSFVARRILSHPAARIIGRLSYAAYLVHWPAYVFGAYISTAIKAAWVVHPTTMTAITAAGAAALHWGVEMPMRRVTKDDVRAVRRRWAWMAVAFVTAAALVGGCLVTDGWAVIKASSSGLTVEQGRAAMRAKCVDLPYGPAEEGKLSVWYSVGCIVSPGEGIAASVAANATLSRPPPVDAAVVGNSFARHLLGGLAAATSPGQVLLVSYRGGCTFTTLRRFDRVADKQEPGCRSFVASQWALLERLPINTTVLVANDWTTSRGFLHSAAAAAEVVTALSAMRLDPVVVGPSPAMSHPDKDALFPCYDLRRYILWPSWLSRPKGPWISRGRVGGVGRASLCPQTYHPRPETLAAHNDLLAAAAALPTAAATAFRYVDLMGAACDRATEVAPPTAPVVSSDLACPAGEVDPVSGTYVLYYEPDGYHLTAYGSAAAAGPLRAVLATATRPL